MSQATSFHYKRIDGFFRPIVPVEIIKRNKSLKIEVLVDSGADYCIFWGEIGEALGIDVIAGKEMNFHGVSGATSKGYIHKVGIKAGEQTINANAVFSYDISPEGLAIVGQISFFENFAVKFDYEKRSIVLRKN